MIVRGAVEADHGSIATVVGDAFGGPKIPLLVERIRASVHYVPDLELVAVVDDAVVGHVMLSYTPLEGRTVLMLSPLAVSPAHQRQGVGSALVGEGLTRADAMAEPLVIVEGAPAYYGRFGFEQADDWGIEPPPGVPNEPFQVKALGSYDPFARGRCRYPEAFDGI